MVVMHTYTPSIPEAQAEELQVQAAWATHQLQDQPVRTQQGLPDGWAAAISCGFLSPTH